MYIRLHMGQESRIHSTRQPGGQEQPFPQKEDDRITGGDREIGSTRKQ